MMKLHKTIAEYSDPDEIAFAWEEPTVYERIFSEEMYLVTGRKGSGKSTIADYKAHTSAPKEHVVLVRPMHDDELYERMLAISQDAELRQRDLRSALVKLFQLISYLRVMRLVVEDKHNDFLTGDLKRIYSFLAQNDLIEGSVIKKGLDLAGQLTKNFKKANRLFTILENVEGASYLSARRALQQYLAAEDQQVWVIYDDLDGVGFEYSKESKAFLEALVVHAMHLNAECWKEKTPLRVVITPPMELLDVADFWNRDKVIEKTQHLRWTVPKLQSIVNRRIAVELGVKKRKRRPTDALYSSASEHTWGKIFPATCKNRLGETEPTFSYLVRHTFYTPRSVLTSCDFCLKLLEDEGKDIGRIDTIDATEWDKCLQWTCEEKSNNISKTAVDLYGKIYDGVRDVLGLFEGRPNVWTKQRFREFLKENASGLVQNRETEDTLGLDAVVRLLFSLGFVGYAFKTQENPPIGSFVYDLYFNYLRPTQRSQWSFAVISPIFYDSFRVAPLRELTVVPHDKLRVNASNYQKIHSYDIRTNSFG